MGRLLGEPGGFSNLADYRCATVINALLLPSRKNFVPQRGVMDFPELAFFALQ